VSNDREKEAAAFREWFKSQRKFSSLAAMERALNITEDYLNKISRGKRRARDPIIRQKLYDATGLEDFKSDAAVAKPQAQTSQPIASRVASMPTASALKEGQSRLPANLPTLLSAALRKLQLTIQESSKKYGVSPNMLKKYKRGIARPSSERNLIAVLTILNDAKLDIPSGQVLPKTTSLVSSEQADLKDLIREVNALRREVGEIDRRLAAARLYEMPRTEQSTDAETRARRVLQTLVNLSNELEFFKQCPESGRMIFKKIVPGPDVGYVTTLLRALFDEDKFQRWLLFSTYEMKGRNSGE
jgi:transcriptional regulator with XRE-family HTH domain